MTERYSRQSFLGENSDRPLGEIRVAIIGLGGGGSHLAQQFAHIGLGSVTACDYQFIDQSNLDRLVGGTQADVDRKTAKVEIAGRLMRGIAPTIEVIEIKERWQQRTEVLQTCDVIFGCVDSFTERDQLERFTRRYLIAYLDIGMDVHPVGESFSIGGQVALSLPDGPCLWCMGLLTQRRLEEEAKRYGAAGGKPQVIWPNAILASTAVGLFMNLLFSRQGSVELPLLLEYDGDRHLVAESNKVSYLRGKPCPHHDGSTGDPFWCAKPLVAAATAN